MQRCELTSCNTEAGLLAPAGCSALEAGAEISIKMKHTEQWLLRDAQEEALGGEQCPPGPGPQPFLPAQEAKDIIFLTPMFAFPFSKIWGRVLFGTERRIFNSVETTFSLTTLP